MHQYSGKPIYYGNKKGNSRVCHFCGEKFKDGQDIIPVPMELKGARRAFEFVFCPNKWTLNCIDHWRFKYDIVKGTNFDVSTYCDGKCNKGDPDHELAEI